MNPSFVFLAVIALSASAIAQTHAGPFGFYYGETKAQVAAAVGAVNMKEIHYDLIRVSTAPKPYPGIEYYNLYISPEKGLLKVVATGDTIKTNSSGEQLKEMFHKTESALTSVYGTPSDRLDFLHAGSMWTEEGYWMMSMLKLERDLQTDWGGTKSPLPNSLVIVAVEATALNLENAYIRIIYEFNGWGDYLDQKQAKETGVL